MREVARFNWDETHQEARSLSIFTKNSYLVKELLCDTFSSENNITATRSSLSTCVRTHGGGMSISRHTTVRGSRYQGK